MSNSAKPFSLDPIGGTNDLLMTHGESLHEQILEVCKQIDRAVDDGATDHLIEILRKRGYTVTPPTSTAPDVH